MEGGRSRGGRQGPTDDHQGPQAGHRMTAALDHEAPSRGFFRSRYGSTSLRVGVATTWLSIIVLLPLAAIVWQSAGGGWDAFWTAITSNSALASFRVTLTISLSV